MATRVAIFGITGRMGKALLECMVADDTVQLTGATASSQSAALGNIIVPGVVVVGDPAAALQTAEVAIDFALPQATATHVAACVAARRALVIGATGHDAATLEGIRRAATSIPVLHAPNMSVGVNVLLNLVEQAARILGDDYDIEIFEAHHRNKKDSPSGTALALGQSAARGRRVELGDVAEYARHGQTGARRKGAIGFSVLRGGDIVGEHVVIFAGTGERVEIAHRAHDRLGFARGALAAARWLAGKPPGMYAMTDVLGLRHSAT